MSSVCRVLSQTRNAWEPIPGPQTAAINILDLRAILG